MPEPRNEFHRLDIRNDRVDPCANQIENRVDPKANMIDTNKPVALPLQP